MEDKLLLEKELEKQETITQTPEEKPEPKQAQPKPRQREKSAFSRDSFKQQSQSSSTIEKPNYDFIEELTPEEEKKVYKIERQKEEEKPKPKIKKLRLAIFSILTCICLIWGIYNVVEITNLQGQINEATQEYYQLNIPNYLAKLGTLDAASSYNDLFDTVPVDPVPPTTISKISNFFDRICNFIARLFGG